MLRLAPAQGGRSAGDRRGLKRTPRAGAPKVAGATASPTGPLLLAALAPCRFVGLRSHRGTDMNFAHAPTPRLRAAALQAGCGPQGRSFVGAFP